MGNYRNRNRLPVALRGLTGPVTLFLHVSVALFLHGCGGLPDDFETLPLEEQVAAYGEHWTSGGVKSELARTYIAWHGWEAADLMAEYLTGERFGIPKSEAIAIIHRIQLRGCSLRGTRAESALLDYLETVESSSPEHIGVVSVLKSITADSSFDADHHALKGGPCQPETAGPQQGQ